MKKLYGILLASLVITTGNLIANYDPPKTVNTDEDFLLWLAFEKPIKFDPTSINDTERTQFIDKGLNLCSKNAHNNDVLLSNNFMPILSSKKMVCIIKSLGI